jgi:plastocyanin
LQAKGVFSYMARRACVSAAGLLSAAALCCAPAFGAVQTVTATSGTMNVFSPNLVTITQGDTVAWNNDGGNFHNVHFEDDSFVMPMTPMDTMWSVSRTFTQPGTFKYYCEVHKDQGMSGTVVVNAPPAGGGGAGGGPTAPPVDRAPVSTLVSSSKQRLDKLFVRASMNETGTLTATGTVSVPGHSARLYRFKSVSRHVPANVPVKLRLKLPGQAQKAVKRALRQRRKLRAKVTLTARDATGHRTVRRQTIRLTR